MTTASPILPPSEKPEFDPVVSKCAPEAYSFSEEDVLAETMWAHGEDATLREDRRFRPTPWGRWILSERYLANDAVYRAFHREDLIERPASEALSEIEEEIGRSCVFCPGDPRFVLQDDTIRLSEEELSEAPRLEEANELERYQTHLPVHTLKATAASEPAGEWGSRSQEEVIDTLGWVRVDLPGRSLNDRMFVARIKGSSMDDGKRGLTDGRYAVFELWPEGTRQKEVLLVRGSFSDPETGSYTLKRYDGDSRDENRERQEIRLVSLNPDKGRFPDIVLTAEDESEVAVVAKLLDPLGPEHLARRPKPMRRKGRRDLTSEQGQKRIEQDLNRALERFFEREAKEPTDENDRSGWAARLVCLDLEAGGLHVETDPLGAFPTFVKTLQLSAGESEQTVIASNLCHRVWRTKVPPAQDGYRWTAPGFEEIIGEDLQRLTIEGLSADALSVFRVGADGIGRLLAGATLSPGQNYRLVLPPGIDPPTTGEFVAIGGGWLFWELVLLREVSPGLRRTLEDLGLGLTKCSPSLQWIVAPPIRFDTNGAGESFPVFAAGDELVLLVDGLETEEHGELAIFVAGGETFESIELPPGDERWVRLSDLSPGSYALEVAHCRTNVQRQRLHFRVSDDPLHYPSCDFSLDLGQDSFEADEEGGIDCQADLQKVLTKSESEDDSPGIMLHGPVYRRVDIQWNDGTKRWLGDLYINETGLLDVTLSCTRLEDLISRSPRALLELDLGEIGFVRIEHRQAVEVDDLKDFLRDYFQRKGSDSEQLRAQYPLLRSLWLDALLSQLYHGVRELDSDQLANLPAESGATVVLAEELTRDGNHIVRAPRRVVVIAKSEEDVFEPEKADLWTLADAACAMTGLREAVITDGFAWGRHEPGRHLHLAPFRLSEALEAGHDELLDRFLYHHAITV